MKRIFSIIVVLIFLLSMVSVNVSAEAPYSNYTYSQVDMDPISEPQAYLPEYVFYGSDCGTISFKNPEDIFVSNKSHVFIADTGNKRIVELNENYEFIREINGFSNKDKWQEFLMPSGVFVDDHYIYVADSELQCVIKLNYEGNLVRLFEKTDSLIFDSDFIYKPVKVVVDDSERVYIISQGTFEGVLQYNSDGEFLGFLGANKVTPSWYELLWYNIMTEEQLESRKDFVPIDFNNICIDKDNFLYCTFNTEIDGTMIKKLNPAGNDTLNNNTNLGIVGDMGILSVGTINGPSVFVDSSISKKDIYSCLDSKRGRVFSYDQDGNLLYVFGGLGDQKGLFNQPVSIAYVEDKILVLDKIGCSFTLFKPTRYAMNFMEAIEKYRKGNYFEAYELWNKILEENPYNELSCIGIGKYWMSEKNYSMAMEYFEKGNNKTLYSSALKYYIKEQVSKNFLYIVAVVVILLTLAFILVSRDWRKQMVQRCKERIKRR